MQKYADVVLDRKGNVVPGATVLVKTQAGSDAVLYAANDSSPISNPMATDNLGRFSFYAANGRYNLQVFIGKALFAVSNDILLEDPQDATPEVIDGGTIKNSALESVTIDGNAPAVAVANIAELLTAKRNAAQAYLVASYYKDTGIYIFSEPEAYGGGGVFYWAPTVPKSKHDGGTVISPSVPWDGTHTTLADFLDGAGETEPGSNGCFVRSVSAGISPRYYGALGDGVTNDGPALNKSLDYIRSKITGTNVAITLDLAGAVYATDISINCTGIQSWGWSVENGTIYGRCTGKSVFDTIGSRGGSLRNLVFDGEKTNMPANGIQAARSGTGAYYFCDNMLWENVTTQGHFSLAGAHIYGQETTTYSHCRFWNYNKDGLSAIHTGFSSFAMSSDYMPPVTGAVSYINNKYINCDYRYLPIDNTAAVTGISKASTAVVTAPGHTFSNGDKVVIYLVDGMTEINNVSAVISGVTANTFQLNGVNSTAFSDYVSGGYAIIAQTMPTVYFARGEQHHFDTCYIVNYGTHSMQIDMIDASHSPKSLWIDCLFEGGGSISHVEFTNIVGTRQLYDFKLQTYNIHCRDYLIGHTGAGGSVVAMYTAEITAQNRSVGSATLLDAYSKFAFYNARVSVANTGMFNAASMGAAFVGDCSWLNGQTINYNCQHVSS